MTLDAYLAEVAKRCEVFRGAHYVDLAIRRGGKDEHHEGDWIRYSLPTLLTMLQRAREGLEYIRHFQDQPALMEKARELHYDMAGSALRVLTDLDRLAREVGG